MNTSPRLHGLCLLSLVSMACTPAPSRTESASRDSVAAGTAAQAEPVRVSAHNVGPIPLDSSFAYLTSSFPGCRRGTTQVEEVAYPTCTFAVGFVSASAWYRPDSTEPPDTWDISGSGIVLADSVRMPDSWGSLRARFPGHAELTFGEVGPSVQLCTLPGLAFFLDFPFDAIAQDSMTVRGIPATARIAHIMVEPGRPSTVRCSAAAGLPN